VKPFKSIESIRNADAWRAGERTQLELADRERIEFLQALDRAAVHVTEWEAQFIKGFVDEPKPLSPRQREIVDKLRTQYAGQVRSGTTSEQLINTLNLPSVAGQCDYLVRRESEARQSRCGQPAVATIRAGLQLCAEHERFTKEQAAKLRAWKERQMRS
jgi:hypothetical protein